MEPLGGLFKSYDIRGIVGEQIYPEICYRIGQAFASLMAEEDASLEKILIGHDMRPSADALVPAFIEGVISRGIDVDQLGLCSTDMLYFASGFHNCPGAIFTASHNPSQYNGIKLCRAGARPIGAESGLIDIQGKTMSEDSEPVLSKGNVHSLEILDDFVNHVLGFIDVKSLQPLNVVVDTANGMGGLVVPAVFDKLPFRLDLMFGELDGTFPNHPADPLNSENLVDLQRKVQSSNADIGLAFDGDADRVFLVDEMGQSLSGSDTTALVAKSILDREPGSTIIHNLICSRAVPETIKRYGGQALRSRVGHSYIKQLMAETDAAFAGEHSGHYYFRDNYRADSGLIAALLVMQEMSDREISLSLLRKDFGSYSSTGEINFHVDNPIDVIERISDTFSDHEHDYLDGLTVNGDKWWFNLRPSNTEPLLRLNLEADNAVTMEREFMNVSACLQQFVESEGKAY
ncbi:MAG: phosphomannomutase/phosphoglucomutase [Acidimicrobiaceae bacterium]|nr:phosphomannomutase/phosphoglucomutase [Acidimicrobiaceae bacterium]|tara:strand:- start:5891 stop:7270 length:1380 start_codon:yes stop_codon:yes gene_type:complete